MKINADNSRIFPSVIDKQGHSESSQTNKLYSMNDPFVMAPNTKSLANSYNRNEPTNHTHQYVYRVDQFKYSQEPHQINNPILTPQPQTYHQPYYPSQAQSYSNYHLHHTFHSPQMYSGQTNGYKNERPLQQSSPLMVGLNHQLIPPSQISQNAYFSRLEYKMPQKTNIWRLGNKHVNDINYFLLLASTFIAPNANCHFVCFCRKIMCEKNKMKGN